jgi:hypothetical protein
MKTLYAVKIVSGEAVTWETDDHGQRQLIGTRQEAEQHASDHRALMGPPAEVIVQEISFEDD